ncbi:MAG: sel1 repeat family protein [Desulfobulbus sp.]|uniref:tetratricopeptide repeat protein n=1 Tax=Desulfobulbus sp. TaxID=895 RepID=UPI0028464CA4|nr:tetratricopeptide repeat protein [Desulfobulbus sp.]MDR2549354.1 sel1 repeat family protein [Desulfobulbus sp.]
MPSCLNRRTIVWTVLQLVGMAVYFLALAGPCVAQDKAGDETARRLKAEAYRAYYGVNQPVNYTLALQLYLQAAERGDAEAQFVAGGMLYQGQGADPDKRNGFKWLLAAAEQGKVSPESLAIIGAMYLRGSTVPQNYLEAKKWLAKAAAQGNLAAQNDLAYLYYNGLGGDRDYKKALELYEKAAFQGDAMAQANTGLMYATGTGTDTDKAKGYAWYSLAASRGNAGAAVNRNNLMMNMSWEELNRAQALSLELYRQVEKMSEPKQIVPEKQEQPDQ